MILQQQVDTKEELLDRESMAMLQYHHKICVGAASYIEILAHEMT